MNTTVWRDTMFKLDSTNQSAPAVGELGASSPVAPTWATTTRSMDLDVIHAYESPVTVGVCTEAAGRPVARCTVSLSQVDYQRIEDGQPAGFDRQPATVDIALPDALVSFPIDEARVLRAAVGDALARYDAAGAPAAPSREVGPWPCLPGCTANHKPEMPQECDAPQVHLGDFSPSYGPTVHVEATASSVDGDACATVILMEKNVYTPDATVEMSSAQARAFAALLLAAADKADALAVHPAAAGGAA